MTAAHRPTRILMSTDTIGGVWTYTLELAKALGLAGIQVALASMGARPSSSQRREARSIPTVDLFESDFRLPWMEDPWADVDRAGAWLLDIARQYAPDLVHLNEPVYAALPWRAATVAVAHSCVLSWWEAVWNEPAPAEWMTYHERTGMGLATADVVVTPSHWMKGEVERLYGVQSGRVIPNGRESGAFKPLQKAALVFAAGRVWDRAKNITALAPVAQALSWPVYVAGEAQHPVDGSAVSPDALHLLGQLSAGELAAWLRRASIYAFPARYEPFGLSVLEAALAECALVLGNLPSLKEQWSGRALFVDPTDAAVLHDAIQSLIDDPIRRLELGVAARQHALTLTPRRMGLAYLALYSELLGTAASRWKESACAS